MFLYYQTLQTPVLFTLAVVSGLTTIHPLHQDASLIRTESCTHDGNYLCMYPRERERERVYLMKVISMTTIIKKKGRKIPQNIQI